MSYKTLTRDVVRDVAKDLLESNNTTTTLEIKQELRKQGYWAKQDDVSTHMDNIYFNENWTYTDNGGHRVYEELGRSGVLSTNNNLGYSTSNGSMKSTSTSSTPISTSSYRSSKKTPRTAPYGNPHVDPSGNYYQMRDGRVISVASFANTGNWEVTGPGGKFYFESIHNRDEVRNAYSRINRCRIQDTLAARI